MTLASKSFCMLLASTFMTGSLLASPIHSPLDDQEPPRSMPSPVSGGSAADLELENIPFESLAIPSEREVSEFVEGEHLNFSTKLTEKAKKSKQHRIGLSVDGGGMRGIMPAIRLVQLQNELSDHFDKSVSFPQAFDYIGGTSIGGILSLGAAADIPSDNLVSIFENEGAQIFSSSGRGWRRYADYFGLKSPRYSATGLETVLQREFVDKKLSDIQTKVLVTACTSEGKPHLFTNPDEEKPDYLLWEVARATSAAPTYFSAYQPKPLLNKLPEAPGFVDGGVWINNPSTLVAASIVKEYFDGSFKPDTMTLLSLGTGQVDKGIAISHKGGLVDASPVIEAFMESHSRGNHQMMELLLRDNYFRINPIMVKKIDLADASSVEALKQYVDKDEKGQETLQSFVKSTEDHIRKKLEKGEEKPMLDID